MKSLYGELVQMDIARAINEFVECILPRFTENKIFVVGVRIEAENYNANHRIGKIFQLVFYRPMNYTFVGVPIKNEFFFTDRVETELNRYSYHDSCWRSDGTEHIVRKFAQEIEKECNKGKKQDYSVFTTFLEMKLINGKVKIESFDSDKKSKFIPCE